MHWVCKVITPLAVLIILDALKELFLRQVDLAQNEQMMEPRSCRPKVAQQDASNVLHVVNETLYSSGAQPHQFLNLAPGVQSALCNPTPGMGYTVGLVPGGRRDRMRLLIPYLDILVSDFKLDEVHIWDTSTNQHDKEWMEQITASRPRYRFFRPRFDLGKRLQFYDYYAVEPAVRRAYGSFQPLCPGATPNSTVVVKIDDDIVFINVSAFPLFTQFVRSHQETLIVYANIINNGVAAYYQSQHVPALRSKLPELATYPVRSQRPGFCGALFHSASKALELHRLFVDAPEQFAWADEESGGCIEFRPPEGVGNPGLGQGSFSVNFFGVRWAAWQELPALLRCVDIDFDEPLLSVLATRLGHRECMFTPLNVAHLSFRTQEENPKMAQALPLYEALLERYASAAPAGTA